MMTPAEIQFQRQLDEEILAYVRGMQSLAPVRADSVESYLRRVRRLGFVHAALVDRLLDLEGRGYLLRENRFEAGEGTVAYYQVSFTARAVLDGAAPWDWER